MSLFDHSVSELHTLLKKKEVSISDLVDESYRRIDEVEEKVQAFLTLNEEQARAKAKELDNQLAKGEETNPLFGLPIGIKDNIVTKGCVRHAPAKFCTTLTRFTTPLSWSG